MSSVSAPVTDAGFRLLGQSQVMQAVRERILDKIKELMKPPRNY
jgi:hypothetical protein